MRLTVPRIALLFLAMVVAMAWEPARHAWRADRCLDAGGSYDEAAAHCDFVQSAPRSAEVASGREGIDWAKVVRIMLAVGGLSLVFIWRDRRHGLRPVV